MNVPRSLRAAIDAKCKDCIFDPKSGLGGWREQVAGCTCAKCPLFAVRPMPRDRTSSNGATTIEATAAMAFAPEGWPS